MDRNRQIIRTSIIGVVANVLLATFKAGVGLAASSIAIVMDAVNNLTDVLSSVITIVGTKLSERPADHDHPFGHGRIEYFSAIIIAIIVLMAGMGSLVESVGKIIAPTVPSYTTLTLVVIVVAIVVKLLLGRYVKRTGEKLKSDALIASGADALFDAVVTLATLVSAGIMLIWNVNLDGVFGTLISLVILKAGYEMLASPINELLGSRISADFVAELKQEVMSFDQVYGVFDIIMNNYGPDTIIGSLHVNVPDTMTAREIHRLTRSISLRVYEKFHVILTVGIYAVHAETSGVGKLQQEVMEFAAHHANVFQVHAFFYYEERNLITIDVVPDEKVIDNKAFVATMNHDLRQRFPDYDFSVIVDHNYSE
jgi:cation diffusion facilitator family transporter